MEVAGPDEAAFPFSIRLFGPLEVCLNGRPLPRLRFRKSQWLLALLALRHGAAVERDWLIGLLWPESYGSQALRNCLTDLRRALGEQATRLHSPTPYSVTLDLVGAQADVVRFDAAIARGDPLALEKAVALYRGPLLEGCSEEWAFQERQVREQRYLTARERLAALALARGEAVAAEQHLRLAAAVDPLRESTLRALMQALAAGGNYAAALLCYRELRLHLHRTLNAEPDVETQTLFQQLRSEARCLSAKGTRALMPGPAGNDASHPATGDRDLALTPDPPTDGGPLRSLAASPHNLPVERSPLIGRQAEVARAVALLRREAVGLFTLTGPGGTGKTRLALQIAADLLPEFEHGIFFVALAPIRDPSLVPSTIAQTLGVQQSGGMPLVESLKTHLKEKQLLLVLDNFEQVLEAAPIIAELLAAAPRLKVLVTSRAVLHLRSEREFSVHPLALPPVAPSFRSADSPSGSSALPSVISQYAAVELFIQRAMEVNADFALTNENAPAVAEICHRLDGLPLAIELAAARLKVLPPQSLLARLERRLPLLTGGPRDLPARQQTLGDTIAWSYDVLPPPEQRLFRRLSVFSGGCTLQSAGAVSNAEGDLGIDILDGLAGLVDKSLLQQEEANGEPRFRMLETIREFGQEQLAATGEAEAVRCQHAQFFLAQAEQQETDAVARFARLEREQDNMRAALAWCQEDSNAGEMGLRLATALFGVWDDRDDYSEGGRWVTGALAHPGAATRTAARGRALYLAAGFSGWGRADPDERRRLGEESLAIAREVGDQRILGDVLRHLGQMASFQGDLETAWRLTEESLAADREAGAKSGIAAGLGMLGLYAREQGDDEKARALMDESVSLLRELGNFGHWSFGNRMRLAVEEGDFVLARSLADEALPHVRALGHRWDTARVLDQLGTMATHDGDYAAAKVFWDESLTLYWERGVRGDIPGALEGLAALAAARGEPGRATRLWGSAAALREALGQRPLDEHCATAVGDVLGEEALTAARAEGRAMSLEAAVEYALEGGSTPPGTVD